MPKVDAIKEEIGWLKLVFGLLVAIDASLIGWLARHASTTSLWMIGVTLGSVTIVSLELVRTRQTAYLRIDELRSLK